MADQQWGFTVARVTDESTDELGPDGLYLRRPVDPPRWEVSLPHQCDRWEIVADWSPLGDDSQDWDSWVTGTPHAEAVAILEGFIGEAQAALEALKAGQEYGGDD